MYVWYGGLTILD